MEKPPIARNTPGTSHVHVGANLSPEAVEFGMAMETYQRRTGRRFPAWSEVLAVAVSLGYRKEAPCAQP